MSVNQCMYLLPKAVYDKINVEGDDNVKNTLASGQLRQLNNLDVHDGGRVIIRNDDHFKRETEKLIPDANISKISEETPHPILKSRFKQTHDKRNTRPSQKQVQPSEDDRLQNWADDNTHPSSNRKHQIPPRRPPPLKKRRPPRAEDPPSSGDDDPDEDIVSPTTPAESLQPNRQLPKQTVANSRRVIIPSNSFISAAQTTPPSLQNDSMDSITSFGIPRRTSSPIIFNAPPQSTTGDQTMATVQSASVITPTAPQPTLASIPTLAQNFSPPAANTRSKKWLGPSITRSGLEKQRLQKALTSLHPKVRKAILGDLFNDDLRDLSPAHRRQYDLYMKALEKGGRAKSNLAQVGIADIQEVGQPLNTLATPQSVQPVPNVHPSAILPQMAHAAQNAPQAQITQNMQPYIVPPPHPAQALPPISMSVDNQASHAPAQPVQALLPITSSAESQALRDQYARDLAVLQNTFAISLAQKTAEYAQLKRDKSKKDKLTRDRARQLYDLGKKSAQQGVQFRAPPEPDSASDLVLQDKKKSKYEKINKDKLKKTKAMRKKATTQLYKTAKKTAKEQASTRELDLSVANKASQLYKAGKKAALRGIKFRSSSPTVSNQTNPIISTRQPSQSIPRSVKWVGPTMRSSLRNRLPPYYPPQVSKSARPLPALTWLGLPRTIGPSAPPAPPPQPPPPATWLRAGTKRAAEPEITPLGRRPRPSSPKLRKQYY